MNRRAAMAAVLAAGIVTGGWVLGKDGCKECGSVEGVLGIENPTNSPIGLVTAVKDAGLKDGIQLTVTFENKSQQPYKLMMCSNRLMCCVKGLHPLLAFDGTGVGLLDPCKSNAAPKEAKENLIPAKGTCAIDVTIPSDRLPEAARQKDKELTIFFCFELADGQLYHSNTVRVKLKE